MWKICKVEYLFSQLPLFQVPYFFQRPAPASHPHSYLLESLRTILSPCPFNLRSGNRSLFFWSRGTLLSFAGCPKPCSCLCKLPFIQFSSIPSTWVYYLVLAEILNDAVMVYLKLLYLLRIQLSWITFQLLVINVHVFYHNLIFESRPPRVLVMLHFLNELLRFSYKLQRPILQVLMHKSWQLYHNDWLANNRMHLDFRDINFFQYVSHNQWNTNCNNDDDYKILWVLHIILSPLKWTTIL